MLRELASLPVGLLFIVTFHNPLRHWWKRFVTQMVVRVTLKPQDMVANMRMMLFVHMKMEKLIVTLHLPDVVSSSMSNIPFYMIVRPDFLTSCDCCGLGWGGVKCHSCYILEKNACLEKVDGVFLPEKAPQLLFSSAAAAIHLNWQKALWLCGLCH